MKIVRATIAILVLTGVGITAATIYAQNYYLPMNKWGTGQVDGEQIGRDGYSCKKYELSYEEAQVAIKKLGLKPTNENTVKEVHTNVNCRASWWTINISLEAQYYLSEYNGQVVTLAAWKNGSFYLTSEER